MIDASARLFLMDGSRNPFIFECDCFVAIVLEVKAVPLNRDGELEADEPVDPLRGEASDGGVTGIR